VSNKVPYVVSPARKRQICCDGDPTNRVTPVAENLIQIVLLLGIPVSELCPEPIGECSADSKRKPGGDHRPDGLSRVSCVTGSGGLHEHSGQMRRADRRALRPQNRPMAIWTLRRPQNGSDKSWWDDPGVPGLPRAHTEEMSRSLRRPVLRSGPGSTPGRGLR
jgi:hypothetical protein